MYIGRNKIYEGADGLIDTSLPMNADFMNARLEKKKEKIIAEATSDPDQMPAPAPVRKKVKEKKKEVPKVSKKQIAILEAEADAEAQRATHRYNLEKQIKEAELEKKEQEIALNKLKIAKLSGEVIPTELVMMIFAQHFKSVTTAFHQGADNFIMTIAKMAGLKREDMATIRGQLIDIVNESVRDGIDESKKNVKNIVREYSERRGVGEKK